MTNEDVELVNMLKLLIHCIDEDADRRLGPVYRENKLILIEKVRDRLNELLLKAASSEEI